MGLLVVLGVAASICCKKPEDDEPATSSTLHWREVYDGVAEALAGGEEPAAGGRLRLPPSFLTSEGLRLAVSNSQGSDGRWRLHLSMSCSQRPMGPDLANQVALFLIAMFEGTPMTLDPFYTATSVHHLVFVREAQELELNPFDVAHAQWQSWCATEQVPFRYERVLG